LEKRGWRACGAADASGALASARDDSPGLAVVDMRLPYESGIDIVRRLRELDAMMFIVILTGYGSIANALEAIKSGADHYLTKPVDADQILAAFQTGRSSLATGAAEVAVPSLARVEWEHIQRILTDCDGNVSQAAKLLGLHRRSLQRKLAKYPPRN
jgi:two-component system response regulator RegA